MDSDKKKSVLRIIPYGIYVLTAKSPSGDIAAATVNWVTQSSFDPPLVVVAVKEDSGALQLIGDSGHFALNFLGKGQQDQAFAFFKPVSAEDGAINGEAYHGGTTGAPILDAAPASVECKLAEIVARGDHHIVIGEVVDAHVPVAIEGRPDAAGLHLNELGENVFYGG
ncbi:MAG: flavin reductase family protein [Proteobacteria bacterium]|nr:flavin reductase family protein [Pseudomonadota bacterium]